MTHRPRLEDRPAYQLIRHFFLELFDFGVLSEAGSDSFRRVLIGVASVMIAFGIILTREYVSKYAYLATAFTDPGPYRLAALGDDALAIGFPMLVVAFATVLVSHSLFPGETDFRVLLPLPISRRTVFVSKLLALMLFAGLFIVAAHAAMAPLVVLLSLGRWSEAGMAARLGAYLMASVGASVFVVLAIAAINGVLLVAVPNARVRLVATAVRSLLLGALVLSVPLLARLPTIGPLVSRGSRWLYLAPPVWFLGAERVLLGAETPYFVRLGQIAALASVASLLAAAASYAFLYRRFDRVVLRPPDAGRGTLPWMTLHLPSPARTPRDAFTAIRDFTRATLARSALHQGVFVAVAACGAAIVMNSFIGVAPTRYRSVERALTGAAVWAPFALVFVMTIAVRAALVLPTEPRANWMFRMTEEADARAEQMNAVAHVLTRFGVVWPLAVVFPIEWAMFGPRALAITGVAVAAGLVLVEVHMIGWRRVPFTCSYMPGKRFVGHTLLVGFAAFLVFTTAGSGLASVRGAVGWLVVMGILGAVVWRLRRRRAWMSRESALMFEDVLPNEVEPLQLNAT